MHEILGQQRAIATLTTAYHSQRVHHAFVFHGPVGVGKFTTARAFAALLLCSHPQANGEQPPRACGQCEACHLMAGGNHPDFQVITKELAKHSSTREIRNRKQTRIPVEVLREFLIDRVHLKPRMAARKVYILDEADLIETRGQNILLKTLEEPPAGTHLILITSNEHRLLVTVRSRCQRIGFVPLPSEVIDEHLRRHNGATLAATQQQWLLGFASGSLGRLDLALRYDLWEWARPLIAGLESIRHGRYPVGLGDQVQQMLDGFAKAWVEDHGPNASKDAANKFAATLLWGMIGQLLGHQLQQAAESVAGQPTWQADEVLEPWVQALESLRQAEAQLEANVHVGMVIENLISRLYWHLQPGPMAAGSGGMRT